MGKPRVSLYKDMIISRLMYQRLIRMVITVPTSTSLMTIHIVDGCCPDTKWGNLCWNELLDGTKSFRIIGFVGLAWVSQNF